MVNERYARLSLLLLITMCHGAFCQQVTLFENVRLFDGEKETTSTSVLIANGKIEKISPSSKAPDGAKRIDGSQMTLLPGLMDAHTHIQNRDVLELAAFFGVTDEFEMMGSPELARVLRREQAAGQATDRADMHGAGIGVTRKGGHGTQFTPVPSLESADGAQAFIDARIDEGSDYIKIVYGGDPVITKEMLGAAIAATHRRGKIAVAHVHKRAMSMQAVDCGIDGLVHLCGDEELSDADVARIKEKGVFVAPTLPVLQGASTANSTTKLVQGRFKDLLTTSDVQHLRSPRLMSESLLKNYDTLQTNVRKLHKAGVPILTSSDVPNAGTLHGLSVHHDLELLVECGLTPAEALMAATSVPADHFGVKDRGRIREGLRANLLLVKGNPLADILDTRQIVGVWKDGHMIDRQARMDRIASASLEEEKVRARKVRPISSFEISMDTQFGMGWSSVEDDTSESAIELNDDGANGTTKSLLVRGKVGKAREDAKEKPYAGALFSPGVNPASLTDLSRHPTLSFWVKGNKPGTYAIVVGSESADNHSTREFELSEKWQRTTVKLDDLERCDVNSIMWILFGCRTPGKEFEFKLDEVRLAK